MKYLYFITLLFIFFKNTVAADIKGKSLNKLINEGYTISTIQLAQDNTLFYTLTKGGDFKISKNDEFVTSEISIVICKIDTKKRVDINESICWKP